MNTRIRSPRSEAVRRARMNADADPRRLPEPIPLCGGWARTHYAKAPEHHMADADALDLIAVVPSMHYPSDAMRRLDLAGISQVPPPEPPRLPPPISPAAQGGSTVGAVVEAPCSAAASAASLTSPRTAVSPEPFSTAPADVLPSSEGAVAPSVSGPGTPSTLPGPAAVAAPGPAPETTARVGAEGAGSGTSFLSDEFLSELERSSTARRVAATRGAHYRPDASCDSCGLALRDHASATFAHAKCDGFVPDPREPKGADRRAYLGSADIGMVVGVSTFGGPWHVWAHKCEDLPDDESEILRVGLELEEGIARLWAWKNGATLLRKGALILHPDDPTMGATPDFWARLADGRVGIVECKNVGPGGRANWTDDDGDAIPQSVVAQTTWQAGIALAARERVEFVAVARLEFGCRIKSAWLDHDPELFDELFAAGRAFWAAHVVTGTPPPLDGSEAATDHLTRRHPKGNGAWLEATPERAALVRTLKDAKVATKEAERAEEEAKQRVLTAIGDAEGIEGLAKWSVEAGRASWKDIADAVAKGAPLDQKTIRAHTGAGSRSLRLLGGK